MLKQKDIFARTNVNTLIVFLNSNHYKKKKIVTKHQNNINQLDINFGVNEKSQTILQTMFCGFQLIQLIKFLMVK